MVVENGAGKRNGGAAMEKKKVLIIEDDANICALEKDYLETEEKCQEVILGESFKTSFFRWLVDGVLRIIAPLC